VPGIDHERASYRFGIFELDLQSGELRKLGVKLKLQDQPLEVLVLLLERAGQAVTREDIQKRLWPENTFVDFDNAINSAVRKLRDALGDSAENPRFIETLARRGYRFIAPADVPAHTVAVSDTASSKSRLTVRRLEWFSAAALVVLLIGAGILYNRQGRDQSGTVAEPLRPRSAHNVSGVSMGANLLT
jgi:DNA-binding winged helix-turn-helix (wHTH) protein